VILFFLLYVVIQLDGLSAAPFLFVNRRLDQSSMACARIIAVFAMFRAKSAPLTAFGDLKFMILLCDDLRVWLSGARHA
jgi:hypothetical protein